ncbi:MAG: gamma carbonic anhydrase family protein [Clostridiales bacterium]|uniref:gamma carbonic anhydrase family protein n=1 Tax=Flavonifractor porci TaxID=3133422 RepID=UPI0030AAA428|nr:gamma carbonic anhydrase family protein [Clostridiales bacterium]
MIHSLDNNVPQLHPTVRIAANATLVGKVSVGPAASIWYGAVLRGDECSIHLGAGSNVQDQAVIHGEPDFPTVIGQDVTVGHGAILHGCRIEDGCLIGMGAILLNGCVIGAGSLVAAGALVTQNTVIPPGSLVMGSPAKVVRPLRPDEQESLPHSAQLYRELAAAQLPAAVSQEAFT